MAFIIHCIQIELELIWELLLFGDRGINLTKQKREPTTNYVSYRVRERSQNKLGTAKLESDSGASSNIVASLSPNQWKGGNGTLELLHQVVASSIIPVSLVFPASLFHASSDRFYCGCLAATEGTIPPLLQFDAWATAEAVESITFSLQINWSSISVPVLPTCL